MAVRGFLEAIKSYYTVKFVVRWLFAIFCITALLSGCIGISPAAGLPKAPKNSLSYSTSSLHSHSYKPYKLQVGDVLDIKLRLNPELNEEVVVRPDGMISTSIADDVPAAGLTVVKLKAELEHKYRGELRNPHIAVILRSVTPNRVYVLGEVASPGEFTAVGQNLTLLQAIARAGGLKNSAQPDDIIILHSKENGTSKAYAANYAAAASGADPSSNVQLEPYDVVFVPRSGIGNAYLYFQQYVQQFVPAAFGFNYQVNPANTTTTTTSR